MTVPVLQVDDLVVRYGSSIRALNGVSMTVGDGRVVALLGANGAGKTTLLRAAAGLLPHHRGTVVRGQVAVFGAPLPQGNPAAAVRAGLTQVMEGRRLFKDLTVEENVLTGATCLGRSARKTALEQVLDRFPVVRERRGTLAGLLSGGQQQMVAIARALVSSPKLLILDEPSLGLSPVAVQDVRRVLEDLKDDGLSILVVEQNVELALGLADDLYVMQRGLISASGPADSIGGTDAIRDLYLGSSDDSDLVASSTTQQEGPLPWLQ
jgi:branched-chain amino acid transport system ATP-binding protein